MRLNIVQRRFILFAICILVRSFMIYLSNKDIKYRKIVACILIFSVVSTLKIIITGDTRKKGFAGQEIWWGYLRPVHVIIWTIFIILTFIPEYTKYAPIILIIDICIGIIAWSIQQQKLGNFSKIFT